MCLKMDSKGNPQPLQGWIGSKIPQALLSFFLKIDVVLAFLVARDFPDNHSVFSETVALQSLQPALTAALDEFHPSPLSLNFCQ